MKKRFVALLLILMMIPCLVWAEEAPERVYIRLVVNGETATPPGADGDQVGAYIINGVLYLPAGVVPASLGLETFYDDAEKILYISEQPEKEAPSHCWVMTDVAHEVDENEQEGPRTWLYEYKDIEGGGRYIIDYTWQHNDEYAHYTAIGEVTNPPAYVYPDQEFIVDLSVYNENVVGDRGWGIMSPGYIQYHSDPKHYAFTKGFYNYEDGEYTSTSNTYNASDGDRTWQMWASFPEGVEGETITISFQFHRGNKHPVRTTWTYVWAE